MAKSNFKQSGTGAAPQGGAKFPHDGQRVVQSEEAKPIGDPMERVPDMAIPAPPTKTGLTPSFQPTMPYPAPPAPRKPFKVS
jgi:hypothetical protein